MRTTRFAGPSLLVLLGCFAGCSGSTEQAPPSEADEAVLTPEGTPGDGTLETAAADERNIPPALRVGYVRDWTQDRIVSAGYLTPGGMVDPHLVSRFLAAKTTAPVSDVKIDWNIATGSRVRAAPAVYSGWTASANTDLLAFAVDGTGNSRGIINGATGSGKLDVGWPGNNPGARAGIYVLTDIHQTKPDLLAHALSGSTNETFGSGHLLFNFRSGSANRKLYALSTQGNLYCFVVPAGGPQSGNATTMSTCSGWTTYAGGNTVSQSAPWPVYGSNGDITDIYFGDDSGYLHRVDGSNGTARYAAARLGNPTNGALSYPVVLDWVIYIGDSLGRFFRVLDTAGGSRPDPDASTTASQDLCGSAPGTCTAGRWNINTSPTVDVDSAKVYIAAGYQVFEFPLSSSATWQSSGSKTLETSVDSGTERAMYSSPNLDRTNKWLYTGFNNKLFKVKYPFSGTTTSNVYSTALQSAGANATFPRSTPLPLARGSYTYVYVGTGDNNDNNGRVERYGCVASSVAPGLLGDTYAAEISNNEYYGRRVQTPMIADYRSGNVNFGYEAGASAGGIVQFPTQDSDFMCPTGYTRSTSVKCAEDANKCIVGCASNSNCSANNVTQSCNTGTGVCNGACSSGFADCNGDKNTDGCEISTNTDVSNCGGCGTTCSTNNITPSCTSGVCGGTCNVGYANCNGQASDGCETATTCNAGGCCGSTCASGTAACVNGTCVTGTNRPTVCGTVSEHQSLTLTCPAGMVVREVVYASYGTPTGSCSAGFTNGSCHASSSSTRVSNICTGNASCTIAAENNTNQGGGTFGDPCNGTFKRLYVTLRCGC